MQIIMFHLTIKVLVSSIEPIGRCLFLRICLLFSAKKLPELFSVELFPASAIIYLYVTARK